MVINAARWTARGYKAEHEQFGKCIERLKYRVKPDPAAFLVNMCNAYYKQLVPPGMGTHSGTSSTSPLSPGLWCGKY
jgi:hypothetical protein|tara:strand:+ start:1242 stop:1472 length:231 start_codon:yes stop_codon:yes gene_type:complete